MQRDKNMNWSSALVLLLCAAAPAACESPDAGPDSDLIGDDDPALAEAPADEADAGEAASADGDAVAGLLRDGEGRPGEGVTKFSEVDVAGTRLLFLRVVDPDTGQQALHLIEGGEPGAVGLDAEPALTDASLLDIFLAVTPASVPVPEPLLGQEDHHLGARGWFRDNVLRGEYVVPRSLCTNSDFQDELLYNYTPSIDEVPEWKLDSSPGGNPDWFGPAGPRLGISCPSCSSIWYFHNYNDDAWAVHNVDANKMAIKVCAIGNRPQICVSGSCINHLGPEVQFWYRTYGNASMHLLWSQDVGLGEYWRLAWTGSPSDANRDWRFRILHAVDADSFDMGYVSDHHGW